jgi:DNA-binding NarL/FixJ family response regulator
MMGAIRVLVANRPRLMRELVMAAISDQPDIEIVGEVEEESAIVAAIEKSHPDFVIIALDRSRGLPAFYEPILQNHPQMKALAFALDRTYFTYYWASLRIQSKRMEASEAGILDALRGRAEPTERLQ